MEGGYSALHPSMADLKKLNKFSPQHHNVRYLSGFLGLFLGAVAAKVTVKGRHNLPKNGPFIIASNHFSYIDPPMIVYAIRRAINFIGASDQIIKWYYMWVPILYGFIPVNRKSVAPSTIKMASKALKNGEILCVYPEGHLGDPTLRPARSGVVFLSTLTKAPIVPVSIWGAETALSGFGKGLRPDVEIRIGKPFGPFDLPREKEKKKRKIEIIGKEIMHHIAALLPDNRHGVFTGDTRISEIRKKYDLPVPE